MKRAGATPYIYDDVLWLEQFGHWGKFGFDCSVGSTRGNVFSSRLSRVWLLWIRTSSCPCCPCHRLVILVVQFQLFRVIEGRLVSLRRLVCWSGLMSVLAVSSVLGVCCIRVHVKLLHARRDFLERRQDVLLCWFGVGGICSCCCCSQLFPFWAQDSSPFCARCLLSSPLRQSGCPSWTAGSVLF